MTDTDRSAIAPNPAPAILEGKDRALQTAVAPKEIDHDDQFDRRDGIAVG